MAFREICKELAALEIENYDAQCFIPFENLQQLFTRDRVRALLETSNVRFYDRDEFVRVILHEGRKVFAILPSIDEIGAIGRFVETGQLGTDSLDARLPLDEAALKCLFPHNDVWLRFFRTQWRFLAPVFQGDRSYRVLDKRAIIPFVDRKPVPGGGHGDVYRVTIQALHHTIRPSHGQVSILASGGYHRC